MSQYLNGRILYIVFVAATKECCKYYKLSVELSISAQGIQDDLTISLKSQKPTQISAIMIIGAIDMSYVAHRGKPKAKKKCERAKGQNNYALPKYVDLM